MSSTKEKNDQLLLRDRFYVMAPNIGLTLIMFVLLGMLYLAFSGFYSDHYTAAVARFEQHNKAYIENVLVRCAGEERVLKDKPVVLVSTQNRDMERAVITACVDAYLAGDAELVDNQWLALTIGKSRETIGIWQVPNRSIESISTQVDVRLAPVARDLPDLPAWSVRDSQSVRGQFIARSNTVFDDHVNSTSGLYDVLVVLSVVGLVAGVMVMLVGFKYLFVIGVGFLLIAGSATQLAKPIANAILQTNDKHQFESYMCTLEGCDQIGPLSLVQSNSRRSCFDPEDGLDINYDTRTITIRKPSEDLTRSNWECLTVPPFKPQENPYVHTFIQDDWVVITLGDQHDH